MRILRAVDRVAVPWKNGGGVTREVWSDSTSPGFDFGWRLSVAEVNVSGPFSRFPLIDRKLAVIKGRMRLTVHQQRPLEIRSNAPPLSFDGDADTVAEVLEPVTDANLMTRRGLYYGALDWLEIHQATAFFEQDPEMVVLVVDPVALLNCALEPLDAIWLERGRKAIVRPIGEVARVLVAKIWREPLANTNLTLNQIYD